LKFGDLEVWKRSSRLCADLYRHFQDIMGMLLLITDTNSDFLVFCDSNVVRHRHPCPTELLREPIEPLFLIEGNIRLFE